MMKKLTFAILPLAVFGLNTISHAATSDGKTFGVSAGWLHVMPQSSAQGVYGKTGQVLGNIAANAPEAGFEVQNADTVGLMLDYFVNDNVSLELTLGAPPEMELAGKGTISVATAKGKLPVIGLDKYDKVATTDAYTPTISARYHFGSIDNKFRPFVGAGLMYAHFSDVQADPNVNAELQANPALAAMKPTLGKIKVDDAIAPVVMLGADYNINKNWFATASVSYAHLSTRAKLDVHGMTLAGQTTLLSGQSDIEIKPIVTYIGLGYRF